MAADQVAVLMMVVNNVGELNIDISVMALELTVLINYLYMIVQFIVVTFHCLYINFLVLIVQVVVQFQKHSAHQERAPKEGVENIFLRQKVSKYKNRSNYHQNVKYY